MFAQRKTVGHAGDVVRHGAFAVGAPGEAGTQLAGALPIGVEQLAHHQPGRRVVFYDAMGSGRSQKGPPETWTLATYVEETSAVCTALGLERYHLFAHSAASFVAFTQAIEHAPDLVREEADEDHQQVWPGRTEQGGGIGAHRRRRRPHK